MDHSDEVLSFDSQSSGLSWSSQDLDGGDDPMLIDDFLADVEEIDGGGHARPSVESSDRPTQRPRVEGENRGRFRLKCKKLFLTFPQCDTLPQVALERIRGHWGDTKVRWCVVSREKHQDGTNHLHVALWLEEKQQIRRADYLDFIGGKHGNYECMRKPVDCVKYVIKDGDFVAYGIIPADYIRARANRRSVSFETIAGMVREGKSLKEVDDVHPGFVLQHLGKLRSYEAFVQSTERDELVPWPAEGFSQQVLNALNPSELSIYSWLCGNVFGTPARQFAAKQLMIISPPRRGKTSLALWLAKRARTYWMPMDEGFYNTYSDKAFDFVVMDEFKAQKTITFMNSFVQGAPMPLRTKGGQVLKRKNLPVMVMSNWRPEVSYHKVQQANPDALAAFVGRFTIVELGRDETLFYLLDQLAAL